MGTYNYPKTTTTVYNVLFHYKKMEPPRQVHAPPEALTFFQHSDIENNKIVPRKDGRSFPEVTYYPFQEK